jgi:hypothetical protein
LLAGKVGAGGVEIKNSFIEILSALLLDVVPNAAAAYSLRKMREAYTGDAIRVRRSSDNTEQDIGFNGSGVLDTTALLAFVGGGNGFVTTWYDQSGNARNATQSTGGNQPQIVSSGVVTELNTKSSMLYDGTDDKLVATFSLLSQPNTIFSVANTTNVSSTRLLYDDDSGNDRNTLSTEASARTTAFAGAALDVNTGWGVNTQRMHSVLYNGNSSVIRRNGGAFGSGNVGVQGLSGLTIGGRFTGSFYWIGNIQELIIYNNNQTSNFTAIETNINDYYNVF